MEENEQLDQQEQDSMIDAIKSLPQLLPRQHTVYDGLIEKNPEHFRTIFAILSKPDQLPRDTLKEIHERTGIPRDTLKTWRKKLIKDPKWTPQHGSPGTPRLMTAEQEARLREKLLTEYINVQKYLTRYHMKVLAFEEWQAAAFEILKREARIPEETPEQVRHDSDGEDAVSVKKPAFSRHWCVRFEERAGLSYRIPHMKRRTDPNDEYVAHFIQEIELAKEQFALDEIWNVDETCWRVINGQIRTIALRGSEEVRVDCSFDVKQSITVVAACSASGKKLPLMLIVKGKTNKCEKRYREDKRLRHHMNKKLLVDHTKNGWSTHDFVVRYLDVFTSYVKREKSFLVWDMHSSHRRDEVKEAAREKGVHLSYIPAGQTGYWQPLDRSIFGALKKTAQSEFERLAVVKGLTNVDLIDALCTLVNAWDQLDPDVISRAWKQLLD